jgi:hypothetical protein
VFDAIHGTPPSRELVPPFFIFTKGAAGRDVVFRGLAAPGSIAVPPGEDLVAVWKTSQGRRFQNYRSVFTILDVAVVPRAWVRQLISGGSTTDVPSAWKQWQSSGRYRALRAPRTLQHRTPPEQLPHNTEELRMVETIRSYFQPNPHAFERCAAELWRMQAPAVSEYRVTQRSVDGGRDVIGLYALGPQSDPIHIDFALEAKCYAADNAVGVREVSRLISRLRHRQFGVLVTTSFLNRQAYKEIREDEHPVVVIAAVDIVGILKRHGVGSARETKAWLEREFRPDTELIIGTSE